MSELINHGKNGFLVYNVQEAINAVNNHVKDINRIDCRKTIEERFTSDHMADNYYNVYKELIKKTKREDHRPWGYYTVLLPGGSTYNTKRIVVYPGKRFSLQRHNRRSEHWHILSGEGLATLDDKQIPVKAGDSVDIPKKAVHRMANIGKSDLTFIEMQKGDYFGEDDIERLEDDFGRK